jgi:hypothetical protein
MVKLAICHCPACRSDRHVLAGMLVEFAFMTLVAAVALILLASLSLVKL